MGCSGVSADFDRVLRALCSFYGVYTGFAEGFRTAV